jgi:hypothetical protein
MREIYDVDNNVTVFEEIKKPIVLVIDDDEEDSEYEEESYDEMREIVQYYQKKIRQTCSRQCSCGGKTSTISYIRKAHEMSNKHQNTLEKVEYDDNDKCHIM